MRNVNHAAGIIFVVLSTASLRLFPEAGPPEGVPAKLNICESFRGITACGDWKWNGHDFDSNYKTNIGTGTIQRTGMEITMSRVDTKAPFGFKGQQAQYSGTIVGNTARGTVTWFVPGKPAWSGTWTATLIGPEDKPGSQCADQQEAALNALPSLQPPSATTPPLPPPGGLEIFDGGCNGGNGNVGTWIFRGLKGEGHWPKDKQIANLTIERFDSGGVVIRREDLPNSSTPGFTATYEGTLHDGRIEGKVTARWLGHFPEGNPPGTSTYTWYGTVPATTCDVNAKLSAEEALETGTRAARFRQSPSAFQCFQIAADQGDGQSKMALGLMYRDGIGTKVDYEKAIEWLRASAVQGDYNAQLALEQMYESGIGTPQDKDKANMWRQRAENNPVFLQQQQVQKNQAMMFMGLAALVEAASRPTYVVAY